MAAVTWPPAKVRGMGNPLNVSDKATGSAQQLIAAPGAGYRLVIDRYILTADTDAAVLSLYTSSDETGNRIVYQLFKAGGGVEQDWRSQQGLLLPENKALALTASAGYGYYTVWYHIEAVAA